MAIHLKKIANPYSIFVVSWLTCLVLYSLGWAEIFPPISLNLFIFLIFLIVVFALTGILFNRIKLPVSKDSVKLNYKWLIIVNTIIFTSNFLYSGIPLLKGTRQEDFGIPTIIVIATTLNCFTSVYCFYLFLKTGKKKFILLSVLCLSLFAMVFSRGNIMMSLMTMFFLWINVKLPKLTIKKIVGIISGFLFVSYLFGVAGNFRTVNGLVDQGFTNDDSYTSNVIMGLGGASDSFREGVVPGEFFWTYLYVTSPLSNLQYNINRNKPPLTLIGLTGLIVNELLFDAVSKRIDASFDTKRKDVDLLVEQLTVPTTLAGSYVYAGWWGMAVFMFVFWLFPFLYTLAVLKNPLGIIGISTLCTVYFFSIFDNMFILTGLMLQIFFPIILFALSKLKFNNLNFVNV